MKKKLVSIFFIFLLIQLIIPIQFVTAAKHNNYNYEQMLIDKLISNYNKNLRPPQGTVQIKFSLNLNQIINLIEKDQIILINAFIDHEWVDKRLSWDPNDYGNLSLIRISGEKVWTPDTFVYTTADQSGFLLPQTGAYFVINHEGWLC